MLRRLRRREGKAVQPILDRDQKRNGSTTGQLVGSTREERFRTCNLALDFVIGAPQRTLIREEP